MAKAAPKKGKGGQRRPTVDDMEPIFDAMAEGDSLRKVCKRMGLHTPTTHTFIHDNDDLRERYTHARELRAEVYAEEALTVTKASALGQQFQGKLVKADGARAYLDAIKWAAGRMAPNSGEIRRVSFENLSDDEIELRLARLEKSDVEPKPKN